MVKLIHKLTGSLMYVHESRVEEYLAAGHRPAVQAVQEAVSASEASDRAKTSGQPLPPDTAPVAREPVSKSDTEKPVKKTTRKKASK